MDVPVTEITDWDSFHRVFAEALGFPDFYGRNGSAWIDCMRCADVDCGMIAKPVGPGGTLVLRLVGGGDWARRHPDLNQALVEWLAFVNDDRREAGKADLVMIERVEDRSLH